MNDSMNEGSDLNPVAYTTFTVPSKDGNRMLTGQVAVYHDADGTFAKISVNGVLRSYERIDGGE